MHCELYVFICRSPLFWCGCFLQNRLIIIKKQSQRFALQELLKQFLAMSRYTTAVSYKLKKQSQRFALQELLKQFLVMSRHTTAISYQLKYPSALLCLRIHLHFCPITHYKAVCRNTQAGIHRFAVIRKQE